jgi:hypothetical protein
MDNIVPFRAPYRFIASFEYSEQVGMNLHPPPKRKTRVFEKINLYKSIKRMAIFFI